MTIREFAESRGISRQFVYNEIKKAGKKTSDLTDKSGQLTEEGRNILDILIPEKTEENEQEKNAVPEKLYNRSIVEILTDENEYLKKRIEFLETSLQTAQHFQYLAEKRFSDLQLKLESGSNSPEEIPIQPDQTEGESQEEKTEPETVQTEEPEQDPEKTEDPKPAAEPEQKSEDQPDGVGESSSPVTGSEQSRTEQKPEEQIKLSLRQRFRILFTGKSS